MTVLPIVISSDSLFLSDSTCMSSQKSVPPVDRSLASQQWMPIVLTASVSAPFPAKISTKVQLVVGGGSVVGVELDFGHLDVSGQLLTVDAPFA